MNKRDIDDFLRKERKAEYRALKREYWNKKTLKEKLAIAWLCFFFGTIAVSVTIALLVSVIYAYIELGFVRSLPITIGVMVGVLTFCALSVMED
jgi:hypothetical protein